MVGRRLESSEKKEKGAEKQMEEDEKHNRVRAVARAALNGCGRTHEQNHQARRDSRRKNVLVWERAAGRSGAAASGKILAFMGD